MGPRVVVIGGGSAYMPGIAFAVAHTAEAFAGGTLVLHDIDRDALDLQRRLTTSILRSRGAGAVRVEAQPDRLRAMEGADVVLAAFRPGGLEARHLDEQIAMDHGIVGQETAGPGGFAMALRSVPIVLEIAAELARVTDDAVLLNYTNPVQIVSEAVHRFVPGARYLGLCDQTAGEQELLGRLLGVPAGSVELDTRGTNHMTFTQAVRVDGSDVTDELWALLDTLDLESLPDHADRRVVRLFRMLRCVPSEYLQYFFFHDEVLAEQRAAGRTRAQEIMAILPEVVGSYRREADAEMPRPSMERASEEHGDFAIRIAATMLTGGTERTILNLPNVGQVEDLPREAIVETPAMLRGSRAQPISQGAMPSEVSGLVRQIASHAALTAEAALAGDRALALKAMAIHPLVRSVGVAESLVDAYLAAHAAHLPRFHPG
ncbi:MAG: glycoside hydrolase family 4 [Actinomycetota bacterium]